MVETTNSDEIDELLSVVEHSIEDGPVTESATLPIPIDSILSPGLTTQSVHAKDAWDIDNGAMYNTTGEDITAEEFGTIIENLGEIANDSYEDIVYHGELLDTDSLSKYYLLTESQWKNIFGETPEFGSSWEPVWNFFSSEIIGNTEMELHDPQRNMTQNKAQRIIDKVESTPKKCLILSGGSSDELSALGLLSEKQAQAYTLRQTGYDTREIAALMDVEKGTVSSHVNRAERKLEVADRASAITRQLQHYDPKGIPHPERVGLIYSTPGGRKATVIAIGKTDNYETMYVVEYESGEVVLKTTREVDNWAYN